MESKQIRGAEDEHWGYLSLLLDLLPCLSHIPACHTGEDIFLSGQQQHGCDVGFFAPYGTRTHLSLVFSAKFHAGNQALRCKLPKNPMGTKQQKRGWANPQSKRPRDFHLTCIPEGRIGPGSPDSHSSSVCVFGIDGTCVFGADGTGHAPTPWVCPRAWGCPSCLVGQQSNAQTLLSEGPGLKKGFPPLSGRQDCSQQPGAPQYSQGSRF